jgi:nucleotide-binding universal stress UspA family protein
MVHIKHILCPVDFSEFSRHAFDRAVAVARSYGSTITVLHVLPAASAVPALPYGPEGPGPFGFEVLDRTRVLGELPRFLADRQAVDVPIRFEVAEATSVQHEVVTQTSRLAADLVVMGSHGRSGFSHVLLGSVAEKTLRTSPVPVLVVPARAPVAPPAGREPFRRVLCAIDFSQDSARALAYATSLAHHGAGQLTLVHVCEPVAVGYDPMVGVGFDVAAYQDAIAKSAQRQLDLAVGEARALGCACDSVVARGRAYTEILRISADRQADVIVLGVHGRNAIDRLVFGSTAEHLVRRASCPVLTVSSAGTRA